LMTGPVWRTTPLLDEPDSVPRIRCTTQRGPAATTPGPSARLGPTTSSVERARRAADAGLTTPGAGVGERAGAGAGLYRCASAPVQLVADVNGGQAGGPVRQQSQPGPGPDACGGAGASGLLFGAGRSELAELERRWLPWRQLSGRLEPPHRPGRCRCKPLPPPGNDSPIIYLMSGYGH